MTATDRDFWTEVVTAGGFAPVPRWQPSQAVRPAVVGHDLVLPPELAAATIGLADLLAVPVESVLLAAHVKVLGAITGTDVTVTGFPAAAPLPCRVPIGERSWRDLVYETHRARTEVDRRAGYPVDALCAELGVTEPLFDTVVSFAGPMDPPGRTSMCIAFTLAGNEIRLTLRHRGATESAARTAMYYLAALRLMTGDPDERAARGSLLSDAEREFQLAGLAGPARELPDRRFHELFEEQVRLQPGAIAAVHEDRRWTYAELNRRANRIGHSLLAAGLRREGVVTVVAGRTLDWMAAVIAVFKAGGVYLPIEPEFPADRIAATLSRSGCAYILAERADTGGLAAVLAANPAIRVLPLDPVTSADYDLGVPVDADQLAYIYFTSGSTGQPKGAMCEHAGMLNHLLAKVEDLGMGTGTVVAQTAPQCFDISLWQLISALLIGGRTLIVGPDVILDVPRFVKTIVDGEVDVVQLVPSYLEVVLAHLADRPGELSGMRCVSVTGEAVKKDLAERWFAACPGSVLVNAYGLTETSDDTNHEVMTEAPAGEQVPLGRAVRNVHIYVVDEDFSLVPLGAPGEIMFSGVCVGRGYVNDPDRTQQVYLPDPHRPGHRMYRSGDFGRWQPGGKLEFLGRRDAQVKIRGFRIEIGEIENRMLGMPGIRDAAVVVVDTPGGNKHLAAFYAPVPGAGSPREFLTAVLPAYLVPSYFHQLDTLPLTSNGKIDKKALTTAAAAAVGGDTGYVEPRTPTERRLASAWAEVLRTPLAHVGRVDDFFDKGGTSLAAVRLVIKFRRQFSLKDLRRHPVLSDLAGFLDGTGPGKA
jgi:amino acid adenylation domain-containing protein